MTQHILLAVGDVAPKRANLASMFARVRETLARGDLVFGQLEAPLSMRGSPAPHARLAMRADPAAAHAAADAGFHVMSFAGNHCLDWGTEAFADTFEHANAAGIKLCGAGPSIAEARKPVFAKLGDVRVAFLAYSSILPQGYWALPERAGCAPMRAITCYEQVETDQPGTPARVHTFCNRDDLKALRADVRHAKAEADIVLLSIHWGIHFVPAEIAEYQRDIAYAAIDDGADAILGHHPHILKPIEIYKGRPIFYSLGNFAIEQPQAFADLLTERESFKEIAALNPGFDAQRAFICPPDTQKSMIAFLKFEGSALAEVGFTPVMINDDAEPETLAPDDPRFGEVIDYMAAITANQHLPTRYEARGREVVVTIGV